MHIQFKYVHWLHRDTCIFVALYYGADVTLDQISYIYRASQTSLLLIKVETLGDIVFCSVIMHGRHALLFSFHESYNYVIHFLLISCKLFSRWM